MARHRHPIFFKAFAGFLFVLFIGVSILLRSGKSRDGFHKLTGHIVQLTSNSPNPNIPHAGKMRFLQLDKDPRIFALFIGKDPGDFSPKFEIVDELKKGDLIDLYYDENDETRADRINNLTQFIDKDGTPVFIRGSADRILGIFAIVFSIAMLVIVFALKHFDKIE